MNILLSGIGGHMGREIVRLAQEGKYGAVITSGVDPNGAPFTDIPVYQAFDEADPSCDVIVDFSHHSATEKLLEFAVSHSLPLVIATTGQTDEELEMIKYASEKIPLFFASNYSVGVALLVEMAKKAAQVFPDADIEIVETHHNRKIDAPSGTALTLAKEIASVKENASIQTGRSGYGKREKNDIGVQSVRMGNIVGIHEVLIGTETETITLKHEAHSRALFAEGALCAAAFLKDKPAGLYDMKAMVTM